MSSVQLTFTLRTSPNVRTVHLLGSWDNYKNQLPLSALAPTKDNPSVKPGSWRGTFRFQGSHALKLGSRYWYYYIVDGYHVSHDPAKEFVTEPTTGRKLNVLDVPGGDSKPAGVGARGSAVKPSVAVSTSNVRYSTTTTTSNSTSMGGSRHSREVPQGRALSPGKIVHPKPSKPYASRQIREADYESSPVEALDELGDELGRLNMGGDRHAPKDRYDSSPSGGSDLSGSSGSFSGSYGDSSGGKGSPASLSSLSSTGSCRCERYGVTRGGQRVKLDCGGAKCGYNSSSNGASSSECSSEMSSDSEEELRARELAKRKTTVETSRHASSREKEREREKVVEKSRHSVHASSGGGDRRSGTQTSSGRRR